MRRKSQIGVGSPPFPEIFMRGYGIRLEAWNIISQPLSGSGLELKGAKCQFDPDLLQGHVQFFRFGHDHVQIWHLLNILELEIIQVQCFKLTHN